MAQSTNIQKVLIVLILLFPLVIAEPITLENMKINGTLCNDDNSTLYIFPLDADNFTIEVDYIFIDIEDLNYTIYRNSDFSYRIPLNLSDYNNTFVNLNVSLDDNGKVLNKSESLEIKQCLGVWNKTGNSFLNFLDSIMQSKALFLVSAIFSFIIIIIFIYLISVIIIHLLSKK